VITATEVSGISSVFKLYQRLSGWHTYCLNLEGQPPEKWYCPMCPQFVAEPQFTASLPQPLDMLLSPEHTQIPVMLRESSVASSSKSAMQNQTKARSKGKGKAMVISTDDEDSDDEEVDIEEPPKPAPVRARARPKSSKKGKRRISKVIHSDEELLVSSPRRYTKRMRIRAPSPVAGSRPRRVRLHMGTGEDEASKGIFDDILSVDDRDTTQTSIVNMDKQRFERSRRIVEVHITLH
jgi:hypothetical protein